MKTKRDFGFQLKQRDYRKTSVGHKNISSNWTYNNIKELLDFLNV